VTNLSIHFVEPRRRGYNRRRLLKVGVSVGLVQARLSITVRNDNRMFPSMSSEPNPLLATSGRTTHLARGRRGFFQRGLDLI